MIPPTCTSHPALLHLSMQSLRLLLRRNPRNRLLHTTISCDGLQAPTLWFCHGSSTEKEPGERDSQGAVGRYLRDSDNTFLFFNDESIRPALVHCCGVCASYLSLRSRLKGGSARGCRYNVMHFAADLASACGAVVMCLAAAIHSDIGRSRRPKASWCMMATARTRSRSSASNTCEPRSQVKQPHAHVDRI